MDHVSPKSQWKRPLGTAVQLFYLLERRNAIDLCPSRSTRRDLGLPRETISSNADVSQRRRCRKNVVSKKKSTLPIISTCYLVRKGVDFPGQEGLREMLRARTIIASPIKRWTMFQTRFSKTIESSRASPTQTWWSFKFFNWITIYLKTGSVWNGNLSPVRNISPVSVQRFFFYFCGAVSRITFQWKSAESSKKRCYQRQIEASILMYKRYARTLEGPRDKGNIDQILLLN